MNTEKENLLRTLSLVLLWIGSIGGIVCLFFCYPEVDYSTRMFQPYFFAFGIATILCSVVVYAFLQVIAEISISLKKRKEDVENSILSSNSSILSAIRDISTELKIPKATSIETTKPISTTESEKENKEEVIKKVSATFVSEEHSNFKSKIKKWTVLKERGLTGQAIKEYQEYTGLEHEDAVSFMNDL